jgi:hypothetical protein
MKALDNAGNTKIAVSSPAPAAPGASTADSFVTISHDADLSAERTLAAGSGITIVDGGANSNVTISAPFVASAPATVGQIPICLAAPAFTPMLPVTDPAAGWLVDGISGLMVVI